MKTFETNLFSGDARRSYHELLSKLLGQETEHWKSSRHLDWKSVEADLGVVLPTSFKLTSNILPAGFLGSGITWTSPDANLPQFRFNRRALEDHAALIGEAAEFSLYPVAVPGYLIFATTSWRIDFAFWVEKTDDEGARCQSKVTLIECVTGEFEDTGIEIDELLYRVITNNPQLKGSLSKSFHAGFFADKTFPIFQPVDGITPRSQQAL